MAVVLLVLSGASAAMQGAPAHSASTSAVTAGFNATITLTREEEAWRERHPVLDVGVYSGDRMPAETWVAGRPEGFGVDYVRLLAGKAGLRLAFHPYSDPEAALADPSSGPYDLLSAVSSLQAQKVGLEMLKPYGLGRPTLVARKGDVQIRSGDDLAHARIAVERDFRRFAETLSRRFPDAQLVHADNGRQALDLVATGQADAYVGASVTRTQMLLLERSEDDLVALGPLDLPRVAVGVAVPGNRGMLLQILRKAEAALSEDEVARLRTRWGLLGDTQTPPARAPTLSELDWLRSLPELRLGFEVDRYPYSFVNSQGQFDGLAANYIEILRKQLGLKIRTVPAHDWNELKRMVRAGEVDLVAATMPEDFEAHDMVFSRTYEHFPTVIVARTQGPALFGPEDLAGRVVAVRDEAGLLSRLRALSPASRWMSVGSNEEGMAIVASRQADAYVGTLPALDALIRDRYAATLRVVGPAGVDQDFSVGIVNRLERLTPLLNRALANVRDSERQAIRGRWLTSQYHYGVPWRWVLLGSCLALLSVGVVGYSYLRQRRAMREQRRAEASLASQLKFQQALLEAIPYPVFVKDAQGRYLAVNRAYEELFQCSREDLLGRTILQTRHAPGTDAAQLHDADLQVIALNKETHRRLYIGLPGADGVPRDVLLWLYTFQRGAERGLGLLGTLVDVSDLRRAEARALASEQMLHDTNESLPGVVMRMRYASNEHGSFEYVSGETEALFGLSREDLLQGRRRPFDVMMEEDKPAVRQAIGDIIGGMPAPHTVEFRVRLASGVRWVRSQFGDVRRGSDGSSSCSVYCYDVTAEKAQAHALVEAKAAAEAAVAAKGAFLAMMSHEIRTPMAGVLSLLELLGKTSLDREQSHMLDMVHDSAGALLQILDDILDFSRIEAGRLQLNEHRFDLRMLADGVLGLFASLAREHGVRLYASIDWRLAGQYQGDMTRVRQIITNLLSNALKFTARGRVELHMELLGETAGAHRVAITVSDTGIGISQEQLDRLFQPFVQAETSTSRRYGGTGLGLTICQRLAHMMGGQIRLSSTPGFGTQASFEVQFPVAEPLRPQTALAGKTVLVCTKDPLLERGLFNTLSALGMSTIGAGVKDIGEYDMHDIDLYAIDLELVDRSALPAGVRVIRLQDVSDPRGFHLDNGKVMLGGLPLLWRPAMDACHVALGLLPPQRERASGNLPGRHDARILVAEDHPINRAVIGRQLERLGYAHTIVENGQEALRAMQSARYDLLLTDCHMPVLDGYALVRRIRDNEEGSARHLPVIALSASVLPEEVQRCKDAGMDEFLAKPVQLATLDAMLSHCLAGRENGTPSRSHAAIEADDRLHVLLEAFGSVDQVRTVLHSLADAAHSDFADFDVARVDNDDRRQHEILHRIRGALRLFDNGIADHAGNSLLAQRENLMRHLAELEAWLAELDQNADPDQGNR
ncbi:MAG TPA: transporter substrate-binding domain-containing protein [Dyella sp.]|uniref:ATP-binding protein n=1 Tax=Dyella sp. TaxID=1869338 RepID=UPI002D78ECD1|nr:transporter substrate-binding domain-containing protein [Dyella sp.]HET6553415.1 transporter substrate-binding domain-containing protein [Dyella sp.]